MNKKIILLIIFCFVKSTEAAVVLHDPVISAVQGVDIIISAKSSDQDVVSRGVIFFRQIGKQEYVSQPMLKSGSKFEGKIPSRYVAGTGIEYYIVLYLSSGTTITSPEQEPAFLPHVIVIVPRLEWFEILYPDENSVIENKRPQISAAFSSDFAFTAESIQVKLDDADVTRDCEITQDFFLYTPSKELAAGNHVVTVVNLQNPVMFGSWQFSIAGAPLLWGQTSGGISAAWQWAGADLDSSFLMYNPGSTFGLNAQAAGQFLGRSFDAWINRDNFYRSISTDFGFGIYGDKVRISAGDVFPSISRLTLDGMPARGCELNIRPFDKMDIYLVGAEGRLFTDTSDEFTAGLLNSKFGGFQVTISPIKNKWETSALYVHAWNYAESTPDMPFSIKKNNDIFSLRTKLNLPAEITLNAECARSEHLTDYGEEFTSESYKDNGLYVNLGKRIKSLALELFYLNTGDEFFSEVNPFLENGRKGFGLSSKYTHKIGVSVGGEYGRYHQKKTEIKANMNLSLSKLPVIFAAYYNQRVPYAKYDVQSISPGASYRFWKLDLSINGSYSAINLWTDDIDRNSVSASASLEYDIRADTDLRMDYFQFRSYESGYISRGQKQSSFGIRHNIWKSHQFNFDLKAIKSSDKDNSENNYFEKVLLFKYGYSF